MMRLPIRDAKHISETSSFKIFSQSIPDNWIIRELTERDYGIDCYIELTTSKGQVTGELISIQLKGISEIKWTKNNYYLLHGIDIATTNYWMNSPIPVFIFMVDIKSEEVYYTPIKTYVRKSYEKYLEQNKLPYKMLRTNNFNKDSPNSLIRYLIWYFQEKNINSLENHINTYLAHYDGYEKFISENSGRDSFMGVEINRVIYLKQFYLNIKFLSDSFNFDWKIESLEKYFKKSQEIYGSTYEIHEYFLTEIIEYLKSKKPKISLAVKNHITKSERHYWFYHHFHTFNLAINIHEDGKVPQLS